MMGLEVQVDGQDENEENEEDWTNEKIFQLANEAWKSNDGARDYSHGADPSLDLHVQVETHAIERRSEDDRGVKTPTPMPKPLPINHHPVRPAGSHVPTPMPPTALPTGATTSSTPDSVDTPIDIQNRRKRILERERLAKLNANTPTRPHVQVSDARMLFNTGSSKRSFAELGFSDSSDPGDDDDDQEGPDPRRKLFTPRLGSEFETRNAELVGRGDIREESVATQGRKEEWEDEREVLDTPSKSSEYKQTIDSEQEFSGKLFYATQTKDGADPQIMTRTIVTHPQNQSLDPSLNNPPSDDQHDYILMVLETRLMSPSPLSFRYVILATPSLSVPVPREETRGGQKKSEISRLTSLDLND
jgi:hypothetical protein